MNTILSDIASYITMYEFFKKKHDNNIYNITINYNLIEFKSKENGKLSHDVIDRIKFIFRLHDISDVEVNDFTEGKFNLTLGVFSNNERLIDVVDKNLIEYLASKFGVNYDWLCGISNRIYSKYYDGDNLGSIFNRIESVKNQYGNVEMFCLKSNENLLNSRASDFRSDNELFFFFRYPVAKYSDRTIWIYEPISTRYSWHDKKLRILAKSIILYCKNNKIITKGISTNPDIFYLAFIGECFYSFKNEIIGSEDWLPVSYLSSSSAPQVEVEELVDVKSEYDFIINNWSLWK